MKRGKSFWLPVALVVFLLLLVALLAVISQRNRAAMLQAPPLTVAEVTRMAAPKRAAATPASVSPGAPVSTTVEDPRAILPPLLARAVTRSEALDRLGRVATWHHRSKARMKLAIADHLATSCGVAGIEGEQGGWYWEAGQEAEKLRNPELAQAYYREALNYPTHDYVREWCLSRLAWYEKDPQVAAALLEASCATNDSTWLVEAARLAHITGSTATRDAYMTRLHDADQSMAERLAGELGLIPPK